VGTEEGGGAGGCGGGHLFRGSLGNDFAAGLPTLRPKIEEVVGFREYIEMMLNYHDGVAGFHQTVKQIDQTADIGQMKANRGFFQKEKMMGGSPGATFGLGLVGGDLGGGQFGHELEALGFSARKGGAGLAQLEVT